MLDGESMVGLTAKVGEKRNPMSLVPEKQFYVGWHVSRKPGDHKDSPGCRLDVTSLAMAATETAKDLCPMEPDSFLSGKISAISATKLMATGRLTIYQRIL